MKEFVQHVSYMYLQNMTHIHVGGDIWVQRKDLKKWMKIY